MSTTTTQPKPTYFQQAYAAVSTGLEDLNSEIRMQNIKTIAKVLAFVLLFFSPVGVAYFVSLTIAKFAAIGVIALFALNHIFKVIDITSYDSRLALAEKINKEIVKIEKTYSWNKTKMNALGLAQYKIDLTEKDGVKEVPFMLSRVIPNPIEDAQQEYVAKKHWFQFK
jgi:hypothetical protein